MKHLSITLFALAAALGSAPVAGADALEDREAARQARAERVAGGADCKACDLFQTDLSYQEVAGRDLSNARLRQANMSLSTFDRVNFAGADLSVLEGFGARFDRSNFAGANFTNASLVGAWFGGANLTGAILTGSNLSGAFLATAKGLTRGQLASACGDADTSLPAGLAIPMCSATTREAPVPALEPERAEPESVPVSAPAAPPAPARPTVTAAPIAAALPPIAPPVEAVAEPVAPSPADFDLPTLPATIVPPAAPSALTPGAEPSGSAAERPLLRGPTRDDTDLLGGRN